MTERLAAHGLRQLVAAGEVDNVLFEIFAAHLVILGTDSTARIGRAERSRFPSCSRPRWRRERTVPTAQPRADDASS